jgi:protein-disulfide isomerase
MAMPAAASFESIAKQDHKKADKFYHSIFENQADLVGKKEAFLKDSAKKAGADMKRLEKDLKDESVAKRIEADMEEAKKFNFSGTPGFLINGVSLRGAYPFPEFKEIIDKHLKGDAAAETKTN